MSCAKRIASEPAWESSKSAYLGPLHVTSGRVKSHQQHYSLLLFPRPTLPTQHFWAGAENTYFGPTLGTSSQVSQHVLPSELYSALFHKCKGFQSQENPLKGIACRMFLPPPAHHHQPSTTSPAAPAPAHSHARAHARAHAHARTRTHTHAHACPHAHPRSWNVSTYTTFKIFLVK